MSLHGWTQLTMLSPFRLTDWRLPSPSSTPKSASFPDPTLQTPRNDSFSTHFADAWSTPRANVHHTPAESPLYRRNSVCERPLSSYSQRNLNPDDPGFHVNHFSSHPNLPLPPVEPARRLSSSPDPGSAGLKSDVSLHAPLPASTALADGIMNMSQMQTPPPTRDASSQRRLQRAAAMNFNTPSTVFSRRDSAPGAFAYNHGDNGFMETPGPVFPTLQFSPDVTNYTNTGPMTVPTAPQARLSWNQNSCSSAMDFQMTPYRKHSFGPGSQSAPNMLDLPNMGMSMGTDRVDLALMPSGDDTWTQTPAMSTTSTSPSFLNAGHSSGITADPFVTATTGVDHNMLFGMADNASMDMGSWMQGNSTQMVFGLDGSRTCDKQISDSNREGPIARPAQPHSRPDTASSSHSVSSGSKPGLARSNTHSGAVRRPNMLGDNQNATLLPTQGSNITRKTSPLKRTAQSSLAPISEHTKSRTRTRLVIDETGRARTETGNAETVSQMDHRTRYSGLWDGEDSDADSDAGTHVASQQKSFSIPAPQLKRSKSTRGEPSPTRSSSVRTEKSPFSFTKDGISKKLGDRLGRLSRNKSTTNRTGRNGAHSVGGLFGELLGGPVDAPVEDGKWGGDEKGDAQDALKKVVERSKQRRQDTFKVANAQKLEAHNQRWAQASADLAASSTSQPTLLDPFVDAFNPSPSNISPIDMLTPSTDRSGFSSGEGIHCICNSTGDDGQLMVQCESCTKWYHLGCLGLPLKPELLPQIYICIFCTGTMPQVRGGRVRDPFRLSVQAHQQQQQLSPLGYKTSYQHRG